MEPLTPYQKLVLRAILCVIWMLRALVQSSPYQDAVVRDITVALAPEVQK